MNNGPAFLQHLHAMGVRAAERWLAQNRDAIGARSTLDLSGLVPPRDGPLTGPSVIKPLTAPSVIKHRPAPRALAASTEEP
jgi:hypothetical protein